MATEPGRCKEAERLGSRPVSLTNSWPRPASWLQRFAGGLEMLLQAFVWHGFSPGASWLRLLDDARY
ncbi:hypothetical protein [Synechococcus sp. 1G10]|uniref:hypothetical protein n=1 Tax=Synechococcus sp. 1G10 TaxID=2025605 RepID=UPI000B99138B|nr:hypothetical protein [Synechococcus sp. 1G10]